MPPDGVIHPILNTQAKFANPTITAKGERRASVALGHLDTLWFNTGTLCNIECAHCYIESSPRNDRLSYLTAEEAETFLREIETGNLNTSEIGFTGGEPFLNPDMVEMAERALKRGFSVLILTNAMRPMMRPKVQQGLIRLREAYANALALRVSLDHYAEDQHDAERGAGAWRATMEGLRWLAGNGFNIAVAGRTMWGEAEADAREGYRRLFKRHDMPIDGDDPSALMLFPEMDTKADVPEITTACWDLLGVRPQDLMCASSRMVVKRKGAPAPTVVACTLLPYDKAFELGETLSDSFTEVPLNHPHCAKFCVLGGGSCSASGD